MFFGCTVNIVCDIMLVISLIVRTTVSAVRLIFLFMPIVPHTAKQNIRVFPEDFLTCCVYNELNTGFNSLAGWAYYVCIPLL